MSLQDITLIDKSLDVVDDNKEKEEESSDSEVILLKQSKISKQETFVNMLLYIALFFSHIYTFIYA